MILVDSNFPMYVVGADHPHKIDARRLLEKSIAAGEKLVTDAEVLQEILHRYAAINRRDAIQPCLGALLGVVDQVYAIEQEDVLGAKDLLLQSPTISARDAIHLAVMRRHGIERIMSFDRGLDGFPGVERLG